MKRKLILTLAIIFISLNAYATNLIEGKLSNGLNYRIYKNSDLPIISVVLKIKAGSIFDPKGKYGLAYITAKSLENCDTRDLTNKELRELTDKYGIKSSISISKGYVTISILSLTENTERVFCILHQLLNSKFNRKGIDFTKSQTIDRIKSLGNDKDYLAIHAAFVNLIKQSSISHTSLGLINNIKNIKRIDIIRYFKKHFRPNNMIISITGSGFKRKLIMFELNQYLSQIKPIEHKLKFKKPIFTNKSAVKDIIKQTKQSYIYFAFPSFSCCNKNYYATEILSYILGGGLDSVLMKDIRTEHGYAYSAFSFNYELPNGGVFVIGLQTQNKFTLKAIERVLADIKNIEKYITNEKVEYAKEHFIGSMPIGLQTAQSIAEALADAYFKGIKGLPWIDFENKIKSVKTDDVKRVANLIFSKPVSVGVVSHKDFSNQIKQLIKKYGYR